MSNQFYTAQSMLSRSSGRYTSDDRECKRTKQLLSCFFQKKDETELKPISDRFHHINTMDSRILGVTPGQSKPIYPIPSSLASYLASGRQTGFIKLRSTALDDDVSSCLNAPVNSSEVTLAVNRTSCNSNINRDAKDSSVGANTKESSHSLDVTNSNQSSRNKNPAKAPSSDVRNNEVKIGKSLNLDAEKRHKIQSNKRAKVESESPPSTINISGITENLSGSENMKKNLEEQAGVKKEERKISVEKTRMPIELSNVDSSDDEQTFTFSLMQSKSKSTVGQTMRTKVNTKETACVNPPIVYRHLEVEHILQPAQGIISLNHIEDSLRLSKMDCFIRSDFVELFHATPFQIITSQNPNITKASKSIQVIGLRCKFCRSNPMSDAYSFPMSTVHLCGASWKLMLHHVQKCGNVPRNLVEKWNKLMFEYRQKNTKESNPQLSVSNAAPKYSSPEHIYWIDCAKRIHLRSYRGICLYQVEPSSKTSVSTLTDDDDYINDLPQQDGTNPLDDANLFDKENLCFFLIRQFIPCSLDRKDNLDDLLVGYPGFACLHCDVRPTAPDSITSRFFPQSLHELIHEYFFSQFYDHLRICPRFNNFSKQLLFQHRKNYLNGNENLDPVQKNRAQIHSFLSNIWQKIHKPIPSLPCQPKMLTSGNTERGESRVDTRSEFHGNSSSTVTSMTTAPNVITTPPNALTSTRTGTTFRSYPVGQIVHRSGPPSACIDLTEE